MTIDDDLRNEVFPWTDPAARRGDVTIFHFALPSAMTGAFATLSGGRVLQYHNITPGALLRPLRPAACIAWPRLGRQELATLVGHVDLALGDSDYNRQELESLGIRTNRACVRSSSTPIASPPHRAGPPSRRY